jgi:outer membrane lipoprotein-sorting protein
MAASKTATVFTSTENRKDKTPESGGLFTLIRLLQLVEEKPGAVEHESLGEKEIDGRKVVGFHIFSQPHDLILWGDPKTGLPVRVEMTSGIEGSVKATFSDFVFNVDMDESLFSLEPPAGYTVRNVRNAKTDHSPEEEKDLIETFREYSKLSDGAFPDSLDFLTTTTKAGLRMSTQKMWEDFAPGKGKPNEEQMRKLEELMLKLTEGKPNEEQIKEIAEQMKEYVETQTQKTAEGGEVQAQETEEVRQAQINEILQRVQRGLNFVYRLPANADAHYVGKGVSFGAADTPIFWYRPKGSKNYRVIYADLSVRDSDTPPNVSKGQPVPAPSGPKE